MLPTYERLGLFYLGRKFDLATSTRSAEPLLYESRDLVTHAVAIGMTGSGKTGLGIIVIEEAALDGVPVLAIDPKGDLANLLLTFPALAPRDFAPWIDAAAARGQGHTLESLADQAATSWRDGLAEWDQDAARIQRLRSAAEVRVYTPGSRAGTPLSILKSFAAEHAAGTEAEANRITTLAASLLSLAGVPDTAPHSREQALLAAIIRQAGAGADLSWLVQQIQKPAFERIGVLDLETFYPARERQELALRFNSVLATPGFDLWTAGEPLNVQRMLFTPDGRPRIAIVSIAHLDDSQRMMAVSLVLSAVLEWTRAQPGTSTLRALVYMDEVFGYLPPVANPPSKLPLLTLLKQARASGVGLMLATQNPVDLDYKALSNTGTWFLGRLQTERDKARVLDGLRTVESGLPTETLGPMLSALRKRVFLMHNVHQSEPLAFETRWTLSYLRGPMTRDEISRATGSATESAAPAPAPPVPRASRPVLPAGMDAYYLPHAATATTFAPVLYASARIRYTDGRRGVDVARDVHVITPLRDGVVPADWQQSTPVEFAPEQLEQAPLNEDATYEPVPAAALNPKQYPSWRKEFEAWLTREQPLRAWSAPGLKLQSRPEESEGDFAARVRQAAREARDAAVDRLRARHATRVARATDKLRRASETLAREEQQVGQQKVQTAVSFGATLVGALMGRRGVSMSTLGRATTAARGVSRTMKETEDVARARERRVEAESELRALEAELAAEVTALAEGPATIETVEIRPKRGGIDVRLVTLAWMPE